MGVRNGCIQPRLSNGEDINAVVRMVQKVSEFCHFVA